MKYIIFYRDVGFLPKKLSELAVKKDGNFVLRDIPICLRETISQYEERTGNLFCYELTEEETLKFTDVFILEDDHYTKLYRNTKKLQR